MSAVPKTDEWMEFFRVYGRLPALWKVSDDVYKNKWAKKSAYARLLKTYQKIYPEANVDSMRRKMNGIRACFRRELRKVERSELAAKYKEDVYVPHLWYYKELIFLRHDIRDISFETVEDTSDMLWDKEESDSDEDEEDPMMDDKQDKKDIISRNLTPLSTVCQDPIAPTAPRVEPQPMDPQARDEASIFAEGWALSYRKLDEQNRLLAKKAIEEILVLGQLNKLKFNSVKMP
ncbi:hypothetical protein KR044_001002 [Drosophila immigrans]|nr:hypothetical protein KR044_001002 [Drosophila immigrans]